MVRASSTGLTSCRFFRYGSAQYPPPARRSGADSGPFCPRPDGLFAVVVCLPCPAPMFPTTVAWIHLSFPAACLQAVRLRRSLRAYSVPVGCPLDPWMQPAFYSGDRVTGISGQGTPCTIPNRGIVAAGAVNRLGTIGRLGRASADGRRVRRAGCRASICRHRTAGRGRHVKLWPYLGRLQRTAPQARFCTRMELVAVYRGRYRERRHGLPATAPRRRAGVI